MSQVVTITAENFRSTVVDSATPVLVDFWAEWCGPCKKLAPESEKVAEEMGDSVVVGKVDMDAERTLGAMFQILSIPTVIIFNKGEKVFELNGVNTAETYMAKLESLT